MTARPTDAKPAGRLALGRRALGGLVLAGPALAQAPAALFAAGAAKAAVERILEAAAAATAPGAPPPARAVAVFGTVGALRDRILAGERPGVAILSSDAIARLAAAGIGTPAHTRPIGRTGVGLAIPAGQPAPDLTSPEALRAALLAAPSFAQADPASGATAGAHMARVIERLGIAEAMRGKTRFVSFGVEAVAMVGRGEAGMAASQATEIIAQPGIALAGLLPEPLQLWTPYAAARLVDTPLAQDLLDLLTGEAARAAFAASGFTP